MPPGKTYIHKMEASELAELNAAPFIVIWWGPNKNDLHNPQNIVYNKYPARVLEAFSDAFGENPKVAEFVAWPKNGVVKVVLDWMLACCNGDGIQPVKDINLDLSGLTSAKDDGEFSRFFKTAYLFDFAQEYKIKHLEDKLKRELEFQAKGKFPLRFEEIYDMANYFWQPNRDATAINFMINSIARGYVKNDITGKRKNMYEEELAIWQSKSKQHCDCAGDGFCFHDDLPEMVARRVAYFYKPENAEELNEEFGKKTVEDTPAGDAGDWGVAEGFEVPSGFDTVDSIAKLDEADKENQAPGDWADDANDAAQGSYGSVPAAALSGGW